MLLLLIPFCYFHGPFIMFLCNLIVWSKAPVIACKSVDLNSSNLHMLSGAFLSLSTRKNFVRLSENSAFSTYLPSFFWVDFLNYPHKGHDHVNESFWTLFILFLLFFRGDLSFNEKFAQFVINEKWCEKLLCCFSCSCSIFGSNSWE